MTSESGGERRDVVAARAEAYAGWAAWNIHRWLAGAEPVQDPEAVLVLGQPGSGKSVVTDLLCGHYAPRGNCVVVDPNELLLLHPEYASLATDGAFAALVPFSRRLSTELLAAAIDARANIVIDGPTLSAPRLLATIEQLVSANYAVRVISLSVPADQSWEAVEARLAREIAEFGLPRRCDRSAHDDASAALPKCVSAIRESGSAEELLVIARDGTVVEWLVWERARMTEPPEPEALEPEPPPVGEAGWRRRWQQELRRKADARRSIR